MAEISIIMPVYNTKEEYFREAIESILGQVFENFEFLVIDNGSDGYIKDIIQSYKDDRIKYFRIENNEGAARARNLGLDYAQSKYIAFLDSDDIAYPERLQKQYEYMEKHPEIGCLGTKVRGIGNLSDVVCFPTLTQHKDIELWLVCNGCVFCQSSVMLRREILADNHLCYDSLCVPAEDYALWASMVGLTKFAVLDDTLVDYRFYAQNTSNQKKELQYQKGNEVRIRAFQKYLDIENLNTEILNKFLLEDKLSPDEIKYLDFIIPQIKQKLLNRGYSLKDICSLLRNHFRKLFYHTHTFSGQWRLLTSPLNSDFGMPLYWRVFCLISRGIFSINKLSDNTRRLK